MNEPQKFFNFLAHHDIGYTELRVFNKNNNSVVFQGFVNNATEFCAICDKYAENQVYAGVNPRKEQEGHTDSIEYITDIVFDIEYDHPKGTMITVEQWEYVLQAVDKLIHTYKYEDVFAVATGNGVQLHFKIKPFKKNKFLQKAHKKYIEFFRTLLPDDIRADLLHDYARIARVPGTCNFKGGQKREAYIWNEGNGRCNAFLNQLYIFYNEVQNVVECDKPLDTSPGRVDAAINLIKKFPCYKKIFECSDVPEGEHHFQAVRMIAFLKNECFTPNEVLAVLTKWDERNSNYEGSEMLRSLIWKQEKKLYRFLCTDGLLRKYCDPENCAKKQEDEDEYVPLVDISRDAAMHIENIASKPPQRAPEICTGFPMLDKRMWGLQKGELTVVAGYTSTGKTAFGCQVGAAVARKNNQKVLYISTEGSYTEIFHRMLSETVTVNSFHFRNGWFTPEERAKLREFREEVQKWNLWICDEPCPKYQQVETAIRQTKPDVVILDYIQRCHLPYKDSERRGLQEWMQLMKTFAKRFNCVVLTLSQLRRRGDNDASPNLWDLFGSGALEMEADNVLLLHSKPITTNIDVAAIRDVTVILAKGRNIGVGKMLFQYEGKYCRFSETSDTGVQSDGNK